MSKSIHIISGIGDQEHAEGLIRFGAFDFLLKPFSLDVVEMSVKRAVEYRKHLLEGEGSNEERKEMKDAEAEINDWRIVKG